MLSERCARSGPFGPTSAGGALSPSSSRGGGVVSTRGSRWCPSPLDCSTTRTLKEDRKKLQGRPVFCRARMGGASSPGFYRGCFASVPGVA